MRFLLYGINYIPELTGVGKYTGEMAEWLAAQGHEVRVVTAPPYYPAWQVTAGFSGWRYRREFSAGVKVWRCPLWVPKQPSGLKRILHLASFAVSSLPLTLWQGLIWQPDIVLVVEPPFFCVLGALLAGRLSGARTWLHIQDFEIDAGFELGLLPSSELIRSLTMGLERWLMDHFDRISTISERMMERLQAKGVYASKCVYFPNWVDTDIIYPLQNSHALREELKIAPDTFVALYSGSMGEKQGIEVLLAAADSLAVNYPQILFVLCGEGSAKKRLLELAQRIPNVRFLNLQPVERLNALLNLANIHLLPQLADAADLVMPSKLKGMCASGRPIIATAEYDTQVAQVVQRCGIVVAPGDVSALVDAVVYLATHPQKCTHLGEAGRQFAVTHWHRKVILEQLEQKFIELCSTPTPESVDAGMQNYCSPTSRTKAIGIYLVEAGIITKSQVNLALKEQQVTGMRLGEIVVARGWTDQRTINKLMDDVILPERNAVLN